MTTHQTKKLTKVEVMHDFDPGDPRKDMDLMCEITELKIGWSDNYVETVSRIIADTKGYRAAEDMATAADIDPPDLSDPEILAQWLELIKPEVIVKDFWTGQHDCRYVAHTTPAMCKKLGTPWERAEEIMQGEIETFTMWAEGDVWGVVVSEAEPPTDEDEEPDWEEKESVWGFYGLDKDNGMRDTVPEALWPKLDHALANPTY